jgi:hypothetical protein
MPSGIYSIFSRNFGECYPLNSSYFTSHAIIPENQTFITLHTFQNSYLCPMFPSLTGNGRTWIYVANRPLNTSETEAIREKLARFCTSWAAHGNQLTAEFDIFYNQLLVLGVDEEIEAASGCSIDQTSAIFKSIDAEYHLDLFNRMNLTFLDGDKIRLVQMADINQAYQAGLITDETIFLDNTISVLADLRTAWQLPFKSSWAYKRIKSLTS